MSLQFIMGPSGAGKSHYLYHWVTEESIKNPKKRYIVLVPEQFTMQTQKDLVMANPNKVILNVEVLSFNRLAYRIMEEQGDTNRVVLNDVGKNLLIRKVVGDCTEELKVLGGNLKKIGYISEMKSVISEFMQYDIQPQDLDHVSALAEKNPNLCYKLKDVQLVYEKFKSYMEKKYITGEEVLDLLAGSVAQSGLLKDSIIVLDGFTGFTPIQNRLLKELLSVCEKMVATVTMDKRENPYVYRHPYQLFALSKQMVTDMINIANEIQVEVEEPVLLYERPVYRFRASEELDFLESHLFRYSKESYAHEINDIQIWCAKNVKEEVDFVAQKIRQIIRQKNYRYKDIAVLASDVETYSNHIEQIFPKYELPTFMDHKRSILLNSCVEYIRSLLAMAEQNFTYQSVFRYLRTGLTDLNETQVDILENYVLAMGIRGYKKWQEKWVRKTNDMSEEELIEINGIKDRFVSSIADVMEVLKRRHKTVFDITKALHTFFVKEDLQKKVTEYQLNFEKQGALSLAKEYAQVYRIVIELLDQFVELLGDEKLALKEYCELLDAGFEEAKVGIIPPSTDQIVVGDVERSRIKDVKIVFLLGVNDDFIPGSAGKNGLLSEYDREQMKENGTTLAPGMKEKTYIQKFYLYLALTKPSEQVYLTYCKTSADGKAKRPAYLVYDLLKLFPKLSIENVSLELKEREMTVSNGIDSLVRGLRNRHSGLDLEWQELYKWYKKHPKWAKKIEDIVEAAFYRREQRRLSKETAIELYGDISQSSASRVEKYAECAYAHFLNYGLRLKEREMFQLQALDLGNLFHNSIEKYSNKIAKSGYTWTTIPTETSNEFVMESVDECIVDYGNSILYSSARNEYVISRLKRMLGRTVWALTKQLEKGDFVPVGYEIKFAGGKIDRVDVCEEEDKRFVKVIDYKTGTKEFNLGELCYGLQMQLVVYMNAAMEMQKREHPEKDIVPAGLFYYHIADPIVDTPEEGKPLEDAILKELRPDGVVQASQEVVKHLDRDFVKTSLVIPVEKLKNGGLGSRSKILTEEEFDITLEFAKKYVAKVKQEILDGNTDVKPYQLDKKSGCKYCPYHAVCGFDEKIEGYEYRILKKLEDKDALQKMREEADAWE